MDSFLLISCTLTVILIIVHAVISRRKGNHENNGGIPGHWTYSATLLISFLLLLIYSAGVCWLFYSDISWPHVGSLGSIFLFVLCPGILFQIFFLAYSLIKRKLPARRIWARLLSILLGVILATQLMDRAQTMAMEIFEETYHPLIEEIQSNLPHPCSPETPYANHESLAGIKNMGHLWHDEEHFILTFSGRSADVDGSTIYFFSKKGGWTIFHNDSLEESKHLEGLLTGMKECRENP